MPSKAMVPHQSDQPSSSPLVEAAVSPESQEDGDVRSIGRPVTVEVGTTWVSPVPQQDREVPTRYEQVEIKVGRAVLVAG